jgi:hypothetical protein
MSSNTTPIRVTGSREFGVRLFFDPQHEEEALSLAWLEDL